MDRQSGGVHDSGIGYGCEMVRDDVGVRILARLYHGEVYL